MIAGVIAGRLLAASVVSRTAFVEVTANIDRGSVFRLYYNNVWSEPQEVAIQPRQWIVYRFSVPGRVMALRFDPSDAVDARTLIRSVTIRSGPSAVPVTGQQIQQWLREGVDVQFDPSSQATRVTSLRAVAYLMGRVDVDFTTQQLPVLRWFRLDAITMLWCILFSSIVLVALSLPRSRWNAALWTVGAMTVSVVVAYRATPWFVACPAGPQDISQTIGHASFFGDAKAAELGAANATFATAAGCALVLGLLARRRLANRPSLPVPLRGTLTTDVAFLVACILVFAIGAVPLAAVLHAQALGARHEIHFDAQNFLVWQYLNAQGALPWRDYWFPYSGMNNQLALLYPEITIRWAHVVVLFAVVAASAYVVVGRSKATLLGLIALWFYLEAVGLIVPGASSRYCLCLSVVLLGAVALTDVRTSVAIAFGLWVGYVFVQEISQLFYAVPGLALLAVVRLLAAPDRRGAFKRLTVAALVSGASIAMVVARFWRNGQLSGWWEFVSTLDLIGNYSARAADIGLWFSLPRSIDQFLVLVVVLTIAGATLQAVWNRFAEIRLVLPAAIALTSVMMLQKQILRPGIAQQILIVPVLGFALLLVQQIEWRTFATRCQAWMAFSGALIVTCFTMSVPVARAQTALYADIFAGLAEDTRDFVFAGSRWAAAREAYFAPASVTFDGMRGDELARQFTLLTGAAASDSIFVLGDDPDLYMVLRRPVAFHPNFYNQSPVMEQHRTLDWIRDHKPQYLIWDPEKRFFDEVPNPVRVPLLFNFAVSQFVPVGRVGKFEILRQRRPHEGPDVAYWGERLGRSIDLGYLPASSRALNTGTDRVGHGVRYLIVRLPASEEGADYAAVVRLAGEPYTVRFRGRAGVAAYPIALDRLPFADAGRELGVGASIESLPPGATGEIKELRFSRENLY